MKYEMVKVINYKLIMCEIFSYMIIKPIFAQIMNVFLYCEKHHKV